MKVRLRLLGVASAARILVACTSTPTPARCDTIASLGDCREFVAGWVSADETSQCSALGGTYAATGECPAADRVGRCTETESDHTTVLAFYSPMYTTAQAQTICASQPASVMVSFNAN